uniref:uncharacterized protein n=1 Tax=Macrobrachium rosenbergii TaxID=79674 RepID=UPI0034D5CC8C
MWWWWWIWQAGGGLRWGHRTGGIRSARRMLLLLIHLVVLWVDTVSGVVMVPESLQVAVTKVTGDGAVLTWVTASGPRELMTSCSLHYGPMTEEMHVQTEVQAKEKHISLANLVPHTTYYAFLKCSHGATTYGSNTVHFTPHGDPAVALEVRPPPPIEFSSPWDLAGKNDEGKGVHSTSGDDGIVVMMSQRHMNAPRRDPHSAVPSTSVILGAVCGVVGFIIINVTVVIAVRQYSHRRARRRRLLELQLEQHGGYLYNFEELMADYNQQIHAGNS